jgi:DNA-binding transcriptional LysR family regulator
MTLEQLRIFVGVAEREHVTRAAEALNLTQSAASAAIAALEGRHGVSLFDRVGRRIVLTETGKVFLEAARAVLAQAALAESTLDQFSRLERGTLRLVASQTIASYWLPERLAHFRARHPSIALDVAIDNSAGVARRVLEGSADVGLVEGMIDEPALAMRDIDADPLLLVSAEPIGDVDDAWLRAARWVMRERGSGTRTALERALELRGIDPATLDIAMVLPSNEAVCTAVIEGVGVAALSALVVDPALDRSLLHAADTPLTERKFVYLRHKERSVSPATRAFESLIHEKGPKQTPQDMR